MSYVLVAMNVDTTLTALADPTRRALLARLARKPCLAGELAKGFAMSRPAVYKHARMLGKAGLISATRQGRKRVYRLMPQGKKAIEQLRLTLEEVSRLWDTALDAFKAYAEKEEEQ